MQLKIAPLLVLIVISTSALGQDYWSQLRGRCQNYGYKEGSDQLSQCVQRLDAENRVLKRESANQRCMDIAAFINSCSQSVTQRPPSLGYLGGVEIVGAGDYAQSLGDTDKQRKMCLQAQEDFLRNCR